MFRQRLAIVVVTGIVLGLCFASARAADEPGYIGVQIANSEDGTGVRIVEVLPDSPAAKAGLKNGDIILKVGDVKPENIQGLVDLVRRLKPGDAEVFKVRRGTEEMSFDVIIGKRPD
jgi:S1-C subfamily serine protease